MQKINDDDIYLSKYFIPLTTKKAFFYIIVIGFVVYFNMLFNGFVWDDLTFIINNPQIHIFNLIHLFSKNEFNDGGYYRPVPAVYFSLLYSQFGQQPFFYHFLQLILHIINTCILIVFLNRFFKLLISFVLGVLFLIHPIQVESVAYIGASQSEILFFFGILALLVCISQPLTLMRRLITASLLLLSLLTKESAVLFPIIALIYLYLFRKKQVLPVLLFILGDLVIYFLIRLGFAHVTFKPNLSTPISSLSLYWRLLNIPLIFFYYIKTLFYPAVLGIDQRWIVTSIDFSHFYFPLICDIVFFGVLCYVGYLSFKKSIQLFYTFLFFFLWFFLGMGILMQVFPLDMTVSERWFYLPFVGLLGILGIAVSFLKNSIKSYRTYVISIVVCIFILLAIRTIVRNSDWLSPYTLYTHDIKIDQNADLDLMTGIVLEQGGRPSDAKSALPYLLTSVRINPQKIALADIGVAYANLGNKQESYFYFHKALTARNSYIGNNSDILVYEDLGVYYLDFDKPSIAQRFAQQALRKFPNDVKLWTVLGIAEYNQGNKRSALNAINTAYNLDEDPSILQLKDRLF